MPGRHKDSRDCLGRIRGGLIAGVDVFTAVTVAGVEVAAPIRPAVSAQPIRRSAVAGRGIVKDQLIKNNLKQYRCGYIFFFVNEM